jgi:hypothetical protein
MRPLHYRTAGEPAVEHNLCDCGRALSVRRESSAA